MQNLRIYNQNAEHSSAEKQSGGGLETKQVNLDTKMSIQESVKKLWH